MSAARKNPFGIRNKLVLLLTGLIGVFCIFIYLYFPYQLEKRSMTALVEKARSIGEMTAYSVSPALLFEDLVDVQVTLQSAEHDADIVYVILHDSAGKVFSALNQDLPEADGYLEAQNGSRLSEDGSIYIMMISVMSEDEKIGELFVGISLNGIHEQTENYRNSIALISLLIFGLGVFFTIIISALVTRPLKEIVVTTEKISQGDLSIRAAVSSRDEIGELAVTFNRMVENLEEAQRELRDVNLDLEQKVTERTQELRQELNERRQAEMEVKKLSRYNQLLLTSAGEGIVGLDLDGKITFANPAGAAMLGWSPDEIKGSRLHTLAHLAPSVGSQNSERECPILATLSDGQKRRVDDDFFWRKNGDRFPVQYTTTPIRNESQQIIGAVLTFNDIADKRDLEEQLNHAMKMEAVGLLAGGVAHDFNNLLTVIIGNVEMALKTLSSNDPLRFDLEMIESTSNKAADLTRQLLAFSSRQVLDPKIINLNHNIMNIQKMLQRIIGDDIELNSILAKDLSSVKADPGQFEQVIVNMIVNARDAMPDGGVISIETMNTNLNERHSRLLPELAPGEYVMVSVSDNGVGMTGEVREKIFDPFFTTKPVGKGTGMGLSSVYGIIRQHNGDILVESVPQKGTTFKIYLPVALGELEKTIASSSETTQYHGTGAILVVEDQEEVRGVVARILKHHGYEVHMASCGEEAMLMVKINELPLELLLTDVVMTKMNGRELFDNLSEIYPALKVLYMSGYTQNFISEDGKLENGVNYIQKPLSVKALVKKVKETLERG